MHRIKYLPYLNKYSVICKLCRQQHKRITTLYKMEHNIIDIPLDRYIKHNTRCSRKHNSQFLQTRHLSNTFGNSFSPPTAKEWNAQPSNIISSNSFKKKRISDRPLASKHHAHWRDVPKGIICQLCNRNRI